MSLGKSPRTSGMLSSEDSKKSALYDQLLTSLAQGGEPLATEEDWQNWWNHWCEAHGGRRREQPMPREEDMPWPIRRLDALKILRVLTWDTITRIWQCLRELNDQDLNGQPSGAWWLATCATEEQLLVDWGEWRREVIQKYRFEGLVSEEGREGPAIG